jgi:hypothetical protein
LNHIALKTEIGKHDIILKNDVVTETFLGGDAKAGIYGQYFVNIRGMDFGYWHFGELICELVDLFLGSVCAAIQDGKNFAALGRANQERRKNVSDEVLLIVDCNYVIEKWTIHQESFRLSFSGAATPGSRVRSSV